MLRTWLVTVLSASARSLGSPASRRRGAPGSSGRGNPGVPEGSGLDSDHALLVAEHRDHRRAPARELAPRLRQRAHLRLEGEHRVPGDRRGEALARIGVVLDEEHPIWCGGRRLDHDADLLSSSDRHDDPQNGGAGRRRPGGRVFALATLAVAVALVAGEVALRLAAMVIDERVERRRDDGALLAGADVAVYGDSTPFGYGATTSFPAELARLTGARIVNRGRPAINSTQTAAILERDLARGVPRVLVVMTGVNDTWNVADVDPELLGPLGAWRRWLPELRLWRFALLWFAAVPGPDDDEPERPGRGDWSRRSETAAALGRDGVARITARGLDRIARLAREKGVEVLFLGYQAPGWNGSANLVEEILVRDHPDRFLAIRDLFPSRDLLLPDAFHPTDAGHRLIATRLAADLHRRAWLPPKASEGNEGDPANPSRPGSG